MGGHGIGWWGRFGGPKIRGLVIYQLSPSEFKANNHLISHGTFNLFRRVVKQLPYIVPAGLLLWGVTTYGKKRHEFLNSKAGSDHGGH
ncbi:ubiquinol--cytochrome-c reductase subunit 8 [Spiromyces aspiralis]|uniref:Ubiquinol--cytochrome-c reductase subunit 8 n=1 Tax=Spiromyces aspiralis TaxID=68401 RepID=A0ACC1HU07_9FUNG|nr:ubiquinol--cytochrome-c reductase subunit 8 [Spiromyces aspiralis]